MKYCLLYFFLVVITGSVQAQVSDTVSVKKWTIAECFQYAAEHNIQINTQHLNEALANQDLYAAKGVKIPFLSGSVSNTFTHADNTAPGNSSLISQVASIGSYTLTSSIVLWNDSYINNNIRQQNLFTKSAGLLVKQIENDITLSITQAYLDILSVKENEKYITDLVNTTEAGVKRGQMLYDAGSIAKVSLLQLQAQLAGDKYLLVQTQNAITQNILLLKQLLQLPADMPFDVITPPSITVTGELLSLQTAQQTALQNFPEIKIGNLGVKIAALTIAKAKAAFKPVLLANGSLGTGYTDIITNNVSPKTGYFAQTGNKLYQNLGLTLSVPIFSNRISKTNLEKSVIAYKQANLTYENDQLVLSQAVERAYIGALNAQEAYAAATKQLQSATESYRIVTEQLQLGAINTYDLLQQRNQYVQAVQAFTAAKYTDVLQKKIYEFYMGIPVTL